MKSPVSITFVNGVIVPHDAISNILIQTGECFERIADSLKIRLLATFVSGSDHCHIHHSVMVKSSDDFIRSRALRDADLIFFEYGFYYPWFEALRVVPRHIRTMVHYQGITHPWLVKSEEQRQLVVRSFSQLDLLHCADQTFASSEYTASELTRVGFLRENLKILPNPVVGKCNRVVEMRQPASMELLQLVYLGRITQAKGVKDLMMGVLSLRDRIPFKLHVCSSLGFAESECVDWSRRFIQQHQLEGSIEFHFDLGDEAVFSILQRSHALICPSHHEGFAIPVIEAYLDGIPVIHSAAGALGETSGGLGLSFQCRNQGDLAARLTDWWSERIQGRILCDRGVLSLENWRREAKEHADKYSLSAYEERLRELVVPMLSRCASPSAIRRITHGE